LRLKNNTTCLPFLPIAEQHFSHLNLPLFTSSSRGLAAAKRCKKAADVNGAAVLVEFEYNYGLSIDKYR
jgi:hypothetical protein